MESKEELQESSEEDDLPPLPVTNDPQRERRPRRMLTYGALGEPLVGDVILSVTNIMC